MLQFTSSLRELKQLNPMKFKNIKLSRPDLLVITQKSILSGYRVKTTYYYYLFLITKHDAIENRLCIQNENIYPLTYFKRR